MFSFTPAKHDMDICTECGEKIPAEDAQNRVTVTLEGDPRIVPGLFRCTSCEAFTELGAISSNVDLKAAHDWLTKRFMPMWLIRVTEIQIEVQEVVLAGARTPQAMATAVEALAFLQHTEAAMEAAAELADDLGEHFGIKVSDEELWDSMTTILREDQPVYTDAELDEIVKNLDLRREPDGQVTYACPNPTCPEPEDRHPLSFAEKILTDQVVQALIGRLPE